MRRENGSLLPPSALYVFYFSIFPSFIIKHFSIRKIQNRFSRQRNLPPVKSLLAIIITRTQREGRMEEEKGGG